MNDVAWEVRDDQVPFKKQYASIIIILLNVVMFLLQLTDPDGRMLLELAFVPASFFRGEELWTIFTSMFMHADITHIFFNMLFFYVVADDTENALGHGFFVFTYFASGIFATLLHTGFTLVAPVALDIPLVGASGAIAGLIAVYGLLFPQKRLNVLLGFYFVRLSARKYVVVFALMQLLFGFMLWGTAATAYFAHLGGLVAGGICGLAYRSMNKPPEQSYYSTW